MKPKLRDLMKDNKCLWIYCGPEQLTRECFLNLAEVEGFHMSDSKRPSAMKRKSTYWLRGDLIGYLNPSVWTANTSKDVIRIDFRNLINGLEATIEINSTADTKIHDINGFLLYRGEFKNGKADGMGIMYYENGRPYRSGYFANGGFVAGVEYYSSGMPKYIGVFERNPISQNYPVYGSYFDVSGLLLYKGEFKVNHIDALVPRVEYPSGYGLVQQEDAPSFEAAEFIEIVSS